MSKKKDVRQIDSVGDQFGMTADERRDFGDYIKDCKEVGDRGSGANGDFTWAELLGKVLEFRGKNL